MYSKRTRSFLPLVVYGRSIARTTDGLEMNIMLEQTFLFSFLDHTNYGAITLNCDPKYIPELNPDVRKEVLFIQLVHSDVILMHVK